jgi:hypothetical protein
MAGETATPARLRRGFDWPASAVQGRAVVDAIGRWKSWREGSVSRDRRVDAYIAALPRWQQRICSTLRRRSRRPRAHPPPARAATRQRLHTQRLLGHGIRGRREEGPARRGRESGLRRREVGARPAGGWCDRCSAHACFDAGTPPPHYVVRPAQHFVCPADIRWILPLTAPRVWPKLATTSGRGLDRYRVRARARRRWRGRPGRQAPTRASSPRLSSPGTPWTAAARVAHAEPDAVLCSGPLAGQFTSRFSTSGSSAKRCTVRRRWPSRRRYFTGHGPATVRDSACGPARHGH